MKPLITQVLVRELLEYHPATGVVTWKTRHRKWFTNDSYQLRWNKRYAGKVVGTEWLNRGKPYRAVTLLSKRYLLHRVIWFYMTGSWPTELDHINGDGTDNRWFNLREVTHSENSKNQKLRWTNKTGVPGVFRDTERGVWQVSIKVNYKRYFLGQFQDFFNAVCARKSAENHHGFHINHGQVRSS